MRPIDHVLAAAKGIALKGQKPNVALIKSRVGANVPMPVIVQGIREFNAMSEEEWRGIEDSQPQAISKDKSAGVSLEALSKQVNAMQEYISQLESRISQLETQANKSE
ncbi:hypothetical protein EXU30_16250 [Shewanella maritima]|uniref:KfrA N-terminal DNA-binding domain-containing protein n=1 Tax=Shewanella maritima TaxID=2520507 RepID=A0A411PKK4_9GAMM|nr:hypothetical protein [Shewanella maritima]QBF84050.1 hypothetical protein EXU30_16250 [Shewanella maritima]